MLRATFVRGMRRISDLSEIARNSLSLIARGQILVTPIIVERLIRAMTTFDPVASDQAKLEQTVRDGQQPFSSGRRERSAAYALLQWHRRNPYRRKKRTAAERLNEVFVATEVAPL